MSRVADTVPRFRSWSRLCGGCVTLFLCVSMLTTLGAPSILFRRFMPSADVIMVAARAHTIVHFMMVVVFGVVVDERPGSPATHISW